MTLAAMKHAAFDQIRVLVDANCKPEICDELMAIIDRNLLAQVWVASTAYEFGSIVQLDPRNGHRYRCATAGTSAATSVAFLTPTYPYSRDGYWVADGTCNWQQVGADYANVVDIRAACHECWMLKRARSAGLTDVVINGRSVSGSQIPAEFARLAQTYLPAGVA